MSRRTPAQETDLEVLRQAYHEAFERWAGEMMRLHGPSESVQGSSSSKDADQAEAEYRSSRDRLAEKMLDVCE